MVYILSVLCCCTFDGTFNILINIIEFFPKIFNWVRDVYNGKILKTKTAVNLNLAHVV